MDACAPISLDPLVCFGWPGKTADIIIISCRMQSFMTIHAPGEKFCALHVLKFRILQNFLGFAWFSKNHQAFRLIFAFCWILHQSEKFKNLWSAKLALRGPRRQPGWRITAGCCNYKSDCLVCGDLEFETTWCLSCDIDVLWEMQFFCWRSVLWRANWI